MNTSKAPAKGKFNDPEFWQGDVSNKVTEYITKGKGGMIPVDLKADEIKAVIDYITHTFIK